MNNPLCTQTCEPCRTGAPRPTSDELATWHEQVPAWEIVALEGVEPKLRRTFLFANFAEALKFTVLVGNAAEEAGHHPAILTEWGKVTVNWWTHKIHGLHRNDFIMAAKTDAIAAALAKVDQDA